MRDIFTRKINIKRHKDKINIAIKRLKNIY